jgi:hypothetical protein
MSAAVPIIPETTPPATRVGLRKGTSGLTALVNAARTTNTPNNTERYRSGTSKRSPTPPTVPKIRPESTYTIPETRLSRAAP